MERELLKEYFNEIERKRSVPVETFLGAVKLLLEKEFPGENIVVFKTYEDISKGSSYYDDVDYGQVTHYQISFVDRKMAYRVCSALTESEIWMEDTKYCDDVSNICKPITRYDIGKDSDTSVSLSLLKQTYHYYGTDTIFPILEDFLYELSYYLEKTKKENLDLIDFEKIVAKTLKRKHDASLIHFSSLQRPQLEEKEQVYVLLPSQKKKAINS